MWNAESDRAFGGMKRALLSVVGFLTEGLFYVLTHRTTRSVRWWSKCSMMAGTYR